MAKHGVGGIQERLRSIVGPKGWDYAVFWHLRDDSRLVQVSLAQV